MKFFVRITASLFIIITTLLNCSHSTDSDEPKPPVVEGTILSGNDSSTVADANVLLYDANSNEPVDRMFSDGNGNYHFTLEEAGTYYLRVEAQGFMPVPQKGGSPIPFQAEKDNTVSQDFLLEEFESDETLFSFDGYVKDDAGNAVPGVLVAATATDATLSSVSGSDGYFVFFNVFGATYTIEAHMAAYLQTGAEITIDAEGKDFGQTDLNVTVKKGEYGTVRGHVSFVAADNPDSAIDVTLIHPKSNEAVPGLVTFIDETSGGYTIEDVPYDTYIVWASFRNDGYVMDPDALHKFGYPVVTLSSSHRDTTVDFKVTGAVVITSPTNSADSIFPVPVQSTTPKLTWTRTSSYASAKEYIVEVSDVNGRVIWGGFDENGVIGHEQIGSGTYSAIFNFDGSASDTLIPGNIYRWKVYADDDDAQNVQTLLSASEYQMGIFYPEPDTTGE